MVCLLYQKSTKTISNSCLCSHNSSVCEMITDICGFWKNYFMPQEVEWGEMELNEEITDKDYLNVEKSFCLAVLNSGPSVIFLLMPIQMNSIIIYIRVKYYYYMNFKRYFSFKLVYSIPHIRDSWPFHDKKTFNKL